MRRSLQDPGEARRTPASRLRWSPVPTWSTPFGKLDVIGFLCLSSNRISIPPLPRPVFEPSKLVTLIVANYLIRAIHLTSEYSPASSRYTYTPAATDLPPSSVPFQATSRRPGSTTSPSSRVRINRPDMSYT